MKNDFIFILQWKYVSTSYPWGAKNDEQADKTIQHAKFPNRTPAVNGVRNEHHVIT